jgi:hypothetical protein
MEIKIRISDAIMKEVQTLTRSEGITLNMLVERGVQLAIAERKLVRTFALRDLSMAGDGLHSGAMGSSWDELRALGYENRTLDKPLNRRD